MRLNTNVLILALCQALMMTANSLLIASFALVGLRLAANHSLATLPLALQLLSTMVASIPASLLTGRVGRRAGFMPGSVFGIAGAALGAAAIRQHRFWWYCAPTVVLTAVAAASLTAGLLHHELGGRWLNPGALPALLALFGALLWLRPPLKLHAAQRLDA